MKTSKTTRGKIVAVAAAASLGLALLSGCTPDSNNNSCGQPDDFFPAPGAAPVKPFADASVSAGAAEDPTLYGCHFDGTTLNSLGEQKLGLIAAGNNAAKPVTVYVDVRHDDTSADREAVFAYLRGRGVAADRIDVIAGPNPSAGSLAAEHISRLSKTESTESSGGSGGSTSGSSSGSSSGSGS
jgi:uncharacterized membrane protein YgcG